jgi:hypothetical protein
MLKNNIFQKEWHSATKPKKKKKYGPEALCQFVTNMKEKRDGT